MDYPLSKALSDLMRPHDSAATINLRELGVQFLAQLGEKSERARLLMRYVDGEMAPGTLVRHLFDCIAHDSAVRDVLTTGHLGKLLCRFDVLQETLDPRVVGLPISIFDERSQMERAEYFRHGNALFVDAELLNRNEVIHMIERENTSV